MKEDKENIKRELLKSMLSLSTAGFGLVAALAWNETIQSLIKEIVPVDSSGLLSKFIYAAIVTLIAVLITYYLGKLLGKLDKEKEQ